MRSHNMGQVAPNNNEDVDLRRAARHRADHKVIAESKAHGDQTIHIVNIFSAWFYDRRQPSL